MSASPAPNQISYRIGQDDGTWSGHTWKEAKNTIAAWYVGTSGRVRIQLDQPNAANWTPALRLHIRIGAAANPWNSLPVTQASASATTGSFWIYNSANETHGSTITATACGSTPSVWQNGIPGYHDTANPGVAQGNIRQEYTELEWSLNCLSSTRTSSTFFFRMTNDGTAFTTYSRLAQIKSRATTVTTSSFTALAQSGTLKESAFATLTQSAGSVKESAFATLAQSINSVAESAFEVLAQAATIVAASLSSFSFIAQSAGIAEAAFATLAQGGTIKEAAFTVLNQTATLMERSFATLAQSAGLKEASFGTLAQSASSLKEASFTTLTLDAQFAGADAGTRRKRWWRDFQRGTRAIIRTIGFRKHRQGDG